LLNDYVMVAYMRLGEWGFWGFHPKKFFENWGIIIAFLNIGLASKPALCLSIRKEMLQENENRISIVPTAEVLVYEIADEKIRIHKVFGLKLVEINEAQYPNHIIFTEMHQNTTFVV